MILINIISLVVVSGSPNVRTADAFAENVPEQALLRLGTIAFHPASVTKSLQFSSDGKRIATGHQDGSIVMWEASSGKEIWRKPSPAKGVISGSTVAFVSNDQVLASAIDGSHKGGIQLWESATGKLVGHFPQNDSIFRLYADRDGKFLVAQGDEKIVLWDVKRRKPRELGIRGFPLTLSPDGAFLAYWDNPPEAPQQSISHLIDPMTERELWCDRSPAREAKLIKFSPGSRLLAEASSGFKEINSRVTIRNSETGKELVHFDLKPVAEDHPVITDLAFSVDGKTIAAAIDKEVRIWDIATKQLIVQLSGYTRITAIAFAPNGKQMMVASGNSLLVWDLLSKSWLNLPQGGYSDAISSLAFSADGAELFIGDWAGNLRKWKTSSSQSELATLCTFDCHIAAIAISPDNRFLAASTSGENSENPCIYDLKRRAIIHELTSHNKISLVSAIAWSKDGNVVATGGGDQTVRIWNRSNDKRQRSLFSIEQGNGFGCSIAQQLAITPDSRALLVTCNDKTRVLWRLWDRKPLWCYNCEKPDNFSAVSTSGYCFSIIEHESQRLEIIEMATGRRCATYPWNEYAQAGVYLDAGRTLALAKDDTVIIFDLGIGKEITRLRGHRGDVKVLAYDSNKRLLASGGDDTTVVIWDINRLKLPRLNSLPFARDELERFWNDLKSEDSVKAYQAVWSLVRADPEMLGLLKNYLRPIRSINSDRIGQWIDDLDNDEFEVRQRASENLRRFGRHSEPSLRKAFENNLSVEQKSRIAELRMIIDSASMRPNRLLEIRAIQVLELSNSPQSKQLLEWFASGDKTAQFTEEAKSALDRMRTASGQ